MKSYFKVFIISLMLLAAGISLPLFSEPEKIRIAVLNFKDNNTSKFSAIAISEFISIELSKKEELIIIERSQIGALLAEQGFQQTGSTDPSYAVEMGKLLAAKKIIIGTLNKTGNVYIITAKVVDVETGRIDAAETERCTKEDDFELASKILANKLINKFAGTSYSIPVRTYQQDEERNRFSLGLMYQFGLYPKYDMPSVIYDASDNIHKFGGEGKKIYTHSLVVAAGYEFMPSFELKAEFGYMLTFTTPVNDNDLNDYGFGDNYRVDLSIEGTRSEWKCYDITIFPMFKHQMTGFNLYIAPGMGYRFSKQNEGYALFFYSNTSSDRSTYILKPTAHAFLLKCEIGTTVYISRFVELVFSIGIDGQVYSNYFKNINAELINGSANTPPDPFDTSGSPFLGYYIKGGFNVRIF